MTYQKTSIFLCFAVLASVLIAATPTLFANPNNTRIRLRKIKFKPNTKLVAKTTIGAVGATVKLRGYLYSTKSKKPCPLKGKKLSFQIGKKIIGKAMTDSRGKAYLKYKVPEFVGPQKLTISFAGDKSNLPCRGKGQLKVIKAATRITANEIPSKSPRGVTIEGILTRTTDGKPLPTREVIATMKGNTVAKA